MASNPGDTEDQTWEEQTVASSQLLSQEGIYQLTQDLRSFSEALTKLKGVFSDERDDFDARVRVNAHQRLGELLRVLKLIINKYSELNSSAILTAAEGLINQVKSFNYETPEDVVPPEIFAAINNLALAFSSSVSECLVGDMNITPERSVMSAQSLENINSSQKPPTFDSDLPNDLNEQDIDGLTNQEPTSLLPHESLDICFDRSKAWSKYAGDLLNYVKKKSHIENEYAKNLSKLSQQTRTILSEQSFLPFQSLYCTAIDQDREFASNSVTTYQSLILAHKFIEPLQAKRAEHDRRYKHLRECWRKDKRRLDEAEANLKKAKQQYQARNQEYQKAKEAAIRAESEQLQSTQSQSSEIQHTRQSSGTSSVMSFGSVQPASLNFPSSKMERKKKQEEETYLKASQAEHYYRACVNEANSRRRELEKQEGEYLRNLRELMTQCDQTMKSVTIAYFSLHHKLYSPLPVQYQALHDDSKSYEPGFQYTEYLRHLMPQHESRHDYKFEPFPAEGQMYYDNQSATSLTLPLTLGGDASPLITRHQPSHRPISDTESSSSRSLDDLSPAASPHETGKRIRKNYRQRRESNEGSLSSDEILDDPPKEAAVPNQQPSPESSPVPTQKLPKTLHTLFNLRGAFKGPRKQKSSIFGVDFSVVANESADGIPVIIKKCITEIDNRALTTKGIYRVNGVKVRVEKLCSTLDSPAGDKVDLSEYSPHDISGVLKYFLRQFPEPLLLFRLYKDFLDVAKEYQVIMKSSPESANNPPVPEEEEANTQDDNTRVNSGVFEERTMQFNMILTRLHTVVNKLPESNRNTLQYIISHLSRVVAHSDENKMPATNLAIVFGPNLLRPLKMGPIPSIKYCEEVLSLFQCQWEGNELQALMDLPAQSQVINMLIVHRDVIFDTYSHQAQNEYRSTTPVDNLVDVNGPTSTYNDQDKNPKSVSSTVSSRSSEVLTTTDQVLLNIEDASPVTQSSSSDDLLNSTTDEPITLAIQKPSIREASEPDDDMNTIYQTNGGMTPSSDFGTIFPDSTSLAEEIMVTLTPEVISTENQSTVKETETTTVSKPDENIQSNITIDETSQQIRKNTSLSEMNNTASIPTAPVRKSKKKSVEKTPKELPSPVKQESLFVEQNRKISVPNAPIGNFDLRPEPKPMSKRHSHAGIRNHPHHLLLDPGPRNPVDKDGAKKEYSGRQLPQLPVSRKKNLRPFSTPGRTPPHHSKNLAPWPIAENITETNKTKDPNKKFVTKKESFVLQKEADEEVSFC